MLNAKLKPVENDEERSAHRYRLLLRASAESVGIGAADVVVHDLSATGFLIECEQELEPRAELNLELPGATLVTGDIVWSSGNFFGGEFRTPLSPSVLAEARSNSPVVWPDFVPKSAADRIENDASTVETPELGSAEAAETRLPLGQRTLIVVGASILLWVPIAFGIWSAIS